MTTDITQDPTGGDGEGNEPKPFYKRWWFIVLAVLVGLGAIGSLAGDDDTETVEAAATTTTAAEQTTTTAIAETTTTVAETTTTDTAGTTTTEATTTTTAPTTTTSAPETRSPVFGAGMQVVGEDVEPGIYETDLLGDGVFDSCYWERLSGFSGEFDDIIANDNVVNHGVVEILASDVAFDSQCAWFELTTLDEPLAAIPQGTWVIGVHIEPGTYQSEGGDTCYWERLSGVTGGFDDIIANGLPTGSAIIEVSASDYAFSSTGCGEWTRRG